MKKKDKEYKNRLRALKQMLKILWTQDKRFLVTSVLEIVIVSITPFIGMYLMSYAISAFTENYSFAYYSTIIIALLLSLLILSILQIIVNNYNTIKGNLIGQRLYTEILNKCLDLDYQKLLDKNILEKKELATKALNGGSFNALIINFKNITASIIVIAGVITIISQTDLYILLIAILVISINGILSFWGKKHQYNTDEAITPINRKLSYYIGLSTDHAVAKEVRMFKMKDQLLARYKSLYGDTLKILKKQYSVNKTISCGGAIANSFLEVSIYLYLGYKIIISKLIPISGFALYGNAIRQFKDSVSGLISSFIDIDNNGRYLKDYFEFIELESTFRKNANCSINDSSFEIRFENVSFIYPNTATYALKNINITITEKTCLSLVGENGSGKTTFVKLLTRLCDPTEGTIYLNGVDIKRIDYDQYQQLFSVIFQDFNLYAFTIKENITMLKEEKTNEDDLLNEIVAKVGLSDRINKASKGLDTYLYYIYDNEGIELSGGESQKLATARAIYKNSSILILDEPTSALDPRSEYEVLTKFHEITNNRTTIYISHRLSSCRFSDNIAVFQNGEIIEYGDHQTLINRNGLYAELYDMQAHYYQNTNE